MQEPGPPAGPAGGPPAAVPVPPYPLGLDLTGRRVLVAGGGSVALRRLPGLLAAGADVLLVAPEVTPAIEPLTQAPGGPGRLVLARRQVAAADLDGAWFVLAATDSTAANQALAGWAADRRVFCVRADAAGGGTARTPASGRHDGMSVAVWGGDDPRRAVGVRDAVLQGLAEGRLTAQRHRLDGARPLPGIALVGAGPGDPELITVLGARLLGQADVVVADRLIPASLLAGLGEHVEVIDAAKLPRGRSMPQEQIEALLVERATAGRFVVRLKGGDPHLFGRGHEEVQAALAAGLPVRVVPGVSSALAVPGLAGIPLTAKGVAQEVRIVSGHLAPGADGSLVDWPALGRSAATVVVLMGLQTVGETSAALIAGGRPPQTPAAAIEQGSLPGQRVVEARLDALAAAVRSAGLRPPTILVIGPVVRLRPGSTPATGSGRPGGPP